MTPQDGRAQKAQQEKGIKIMKNRTIDLVVLLLSCLALLPIVQAVNPAPADLTKYQTRNMILILLRERLSSVILPRVYYSDGTIYGR
jgi:hypothetical protein